ncbi:MAG: hypothetical protein IPO92_24325 [Saprospiraceae bacterium]|nr:hypothetical protein [Saprospiraceae bacterium]
MIRIVLQQTETVFTSPYDYTNPPAQTTDPKQIIYKVKLFNQGTTAAQNVQVAVKLDANLDPSTVEILDAEYPYTKTITGNNLAIKFNNIYLCLVTTNLLPFSYL